jgi:coenzyme PQQ precursor peptide PqqA
MGDGLSHIGGAGAERRCDRKYGRSSRNPTGSTSMRKVWKTPRVTARPASMEVTMYLPAEV